MTCDEIRALFSDVADARLAPGEQAAWDAHLATCADCRREWASFQRTLGLLQGLPRHRAPDGFVDRVMTAAYPQPWPRRLARRLFVPLRMKVPLEAAALALLAVTGVYLVQRTPEMQQAMHDAGPPSNAPPAPAAPPAPVVTAPAAPAPAPAASSPSPGTPVQSPASPASRPEAARKDGLQAQAKPESKERADQMAASENAPGKAAEQGSVQAPQSPEPRTREVAPAPAPGAQVPSRGFSGGGLARQERIRTTAAAAPMVVGRLTVEDRDAAAPALAALIARVGATELSRTLVEDGTLIELDVPRAHYAEFARGLAAIGGWTPREERSGPGAEVRVRVVVGPPAR
jgi:Predicted integral membrane protein (DUF2275)/Putative zinc-finger